MASPYTFDELLNMIEIQIANLPTYFTELGATAADVAKREKWRDNMIRVRDYCELADVNKKTAFANKATIMTGKKGDPCSDFAAISTGTWADPSQGVGYLEQCLQDNRRWLNSPDCTPEIATACALKRTTTPPDAATVKPKVECDVAEAGGYHMTMIVKNRGEATSWEGFWRVAGTPDWASTGVHTMRAANLVWPNGDGKPVLLEVRAQGRKSDQPYGQMSDIVQVTLNP